ncbi:MAG: FKBP-type peptidyl-prolyl cis-trans isomerase [Reichenbachiella sp.]
MKFSPFILVVVIALGVLSCENKKTNIVTKSGVSVDFINKGDSAGFKAKEIVLLNMLGVYQGGDTLFNTLNGGLPQPMMFDSAQWASGGTFYEAIESCGNGDSIVFSVTANDFFLNTFKSPVPDSVKGADKINFTVGIDDVMSMEAFQAYRSAKMIELEKVTIDKYLSDNNLTAEKTESGLLYIVTEQGDGAKPVVGDNVKVHYRGAFLDDREFDSSIGKDPFEFPLGQGRVIKAWDEGIALLNVGSKATLIVPSALGYGERGAGSIPPNTILKFDVELLGIK